MTVLGPYGTIVDDLAIVAANLPVESELGCAAHATDAVLAPLADDPLLRERCKARLRALADGERSVYRQPPGLLLRHAGRLVSTTRPVLHEGFRIEPTAERSGDLEQLRSVIGDRLWAATPGVWTAWGSKTRFRARCAELLGERSLPPGVDLTASGPVEVLEALRPFETDPGPIILKLPGAGGLGNLVLHPAASADWPDQVRELWGRPNLAHAPLDVVVERWLPWDSTYSVSYLLSPGRPPELLAACEQIVDPVDGAWIGSRSHGALEPTDLDAVLHLLRPIVDALAADGYHGVAALDVVVGDGSTWQDRGLDLPDGRRMAVIECNPRFNQHNRVGLVVERLARRWNVPAADLSWVLRIHESPAGSTLSDLLASLEDEPCHLPDAPTRERPARLAFVFPRARAASLKVARIP